MPLTPYHARYSLTSVSTDPIGRWPYSVDE